MRRRWKSYSESIHKPCHSPPPTEDAADVADRRRRWKPSLWLLCEDDEDGSNSLLNQQFSSKISDSARINSFSGELPLSLSNLTRISELGISENNFSGELSSDFITNWT
ncbi:hypothetical protein L1987_81836 [Smallanthus sonchifolius]|uniref:Uncharacterized protein n=1 Tax=Smallanthus sonchifolius TaxID=185202 RepID=A0ACB8YSN5_9ASTR|nr:hypothetical protein L1987_81836 [Smallanthus sonchifolius]